MFKNMKIKSKLLSGFCVLLVIVIAIASFATISTISINRELSHLLSYPNERVQWYLSFPTEVANLRRLITTVAWRTGDADAIASTESEIADVKKNLLQYISQLRNNLDNDPQIVDDELKTRLDNLTDLENLVNNYMDNIVNPTIAAAKANDAETVASLGQAGSPIISQMMDINSWMISSARDSIENATTYMNSTASNITLVMIIVAVSGVIIGLVIAMVLSNSISKPIHRAALTLSSVAQGDLNVNLDRENSSKDEIGELTRDVIVLVDVIREIVQDYREIYQKYNVQGKMNARLDASKYKNSFREMVESVNTILSSDVENLMEMKSILSKISNGDFNVIVKDLPGDHMIFTQTYRDVLANLKNVSFEVETMIDAAAVKGDLSFKIDETKYSGDWRKIMKGLNSVCQAVNAPIVDIRNAIAILKTGKFNVSINGNYAGAFLSIKNDFNGYINELSQYIQEIDACLGAVASGNLNRTISMYFEGDFDKIKQSVNLISTTLHKTMTEINSASENVLSGSKHIATSAIDLANGAQTQASSVQELNATIDTISQQTKDNADHATNANKLSAKSTVNAKDGNEAMKHMLDAMSQIKDSSHNISKIIKVIQDIAFQTNLLSLNAAVEAARAGEHGKGFAVVAEEVRNLAGRSQEAAVETNNLISDSIDRVESGSSIAQSTSDSLDTIVKNVSEVSEIIDNISHASKEQAEAIEQVSIGLNQISIIVQSNSAISQEAAAASEELNSQAELLKDMVSFFKL